MWHYDRFWYMSLETSKIKNQEIKNLIKKVNIFWEGHNILWNLHLILTVCSTSQNKVETSQNFVAFSEYMNFN